MTTYKRNGVIMKSFANWSILIFIITVLFAGLSGCGYGKNVSLPRGTEYAIVESDLLRASHGRVLSFDKHGKKLGESRLSLQDGEFLAADSERNFLYRWCAQ